MAGGFLLAESFLPAVARFNAADKARVLDFISAFQQDPANPGISLERIREARSSDVWAGRISRDLRAILYKDGETWVALHADHHDPAYRWAARREVGRHPVTGSLQVIEVLENVRNEVGQSADLGLFSSHTDQYLLSLGVPETWLPVLREIATEDQLLEVAVRLPSDVAERLIRLAAGELVTPPAPVPPERPLETTPEIGQRFFVVDDRSDLRAVLDAPLAKWIAFLHPSQRALVERNHGGPVRVTGSAGTGKTTVAMHRARHLARQGKHVLLTTFVTTLAENLLRQLRLFCTPDELARITVSTVHSRALAVAREIDPRLGPASNETVRGVLDSMRLRYTPKLDAAFVRAEWESVVQLQGIASWNEYRSARRSGRGRPLSVADRRALWQVFEAVLADLQGRRRLDWPGICRYAQEELEQGRAHGTYDAVLVDEIQDLKPPELRFLRALAASSAQNLMLFGDSGQRIYPGGFSLSALGIATRGRSHVLRLNYRTTEQIRRAADSVLGIEADDLDGGRESRGETRSLLRGPDVALKGYESYDTEADEARRRVQRWMGAGLRPESIAVFARTKKRVDQVADALRDAGLPVHLLQDEDPTDANAIQLGTMHRAKGLEFKAVLVCDCSSTALPPHALLSEQSDPADREDAIARERRLLYVAMTRARDELAITWVGAPSPFLASLLERKESP